MSIFTMSVLIVCSIVVVLCVISMIRNQFVYRARISFIDNRFQDYDKLPSYDDMLFNPKHYGRWTYKHWVNYVIR